jgi:hypothetical protein
MFIIEASEVFLDRPECEAQPLLLDPGRKWFNGFFSIGSTKKPLERPYVVSTTSRPSQARTKHGPR